MYCIRSVIKYACALFHNSLPKYHALQIIYPYISYDQALKETGQKSLYKRRDEITSKLFINACNTKRKLNKLLPKKFTCPCNLRRKRTFANPMTSTNRT